MAPSIFHSQLKGVPRRERAWRSAASTFFVVGFFVLVLGVYSAIHPASTASQGRHISKQSINRRALSGRSEDLECHLVHRAQDKCAFVRQNCADEEAGLFSYLQFYYCNSPTVQPFALGVIVLWLCLLFSTIGIAASDFFCINLSTISQLLGLSESLAGVTFLAFGNGSPDVFSTFAAMSTNSGSLAVGELIGAAGFITAVVAGAMAFVSPFKVARKSFVRDVTFFIIAATFSMVFLYDGKLYLWEAITMVGLYVFYVIFVVIWHWWFNRRKKKRMTIAAARTQWQGSGSEIAEFPAYHDEDEPDNSQERPSPGRETAIEDLSLLENGRDGNDEDSDVENEDRDKRELGELVSEMRLRRPTIRGRRRTQNPILRPNLIGVLEFRSVFSGLQHSGTGQQDFPLNHRRHSDAARFENGQLSDTRSMISEPASRTAYEIDPEGNDSTSQGLQPPGESRGLRERAISAPDPALLRHAANTIPRIDLLGPVVEDDGSRSPPKRQNTLDLLGIPPASPSLTLSPPASRRSSRSPSPAPSHARTNSSHLAPPGSFAHTQQHKVADLAVDSAIPSPKSKPQKPSLRIPAPDATSFFPPQGGRTPSIRLPSPSTMLENPVEGAFRVAKPLRWWPYSIVPSPYELWVTLFPTLCGWKEKNWWERILGIIAAPSVFVLTITLPVVEIESEDDDQPDDDIPDMTLPPHTPSDLNGSGVSIIIEPDQADSHDVAAAYSKGFAGHGTSATVAASTEHHQHPNHLHHEAPPHSHHNSHHHLPSILSPVERNTITDSPEQLSTPAPKPPSARDWNRWLVITQAFTAPFFIVLIVWAKVDAGEPQALIRPTLISLICSLVTLAIILATTTPTRAPKWRVGLCFLGFIVSISWISSIADEVVGVLKSIGVILNISDAILGLTIFAVGNSLGDLVADYTVAKLGYPVMALSACFGGPMLNILLGVGLSGTYLTIKHANERVEHHPGRKLKFKPYEIEVSRTLMISGATLLVTLVGLLIVVPLRRWKMDRFVGYCLFAIWGLSTASNVLVEILGVGRSTAM